MEVNKTLKSILEQKSKIKIHDCLHSYLIFIFDDKFVCRIGKHSKDFYNQSDKFQVAFYNEIYQPYYTDEDILRIVMSVNGNYFSTDEENNDFDQSLDTELCEKIYNLLLYKMFNVNEILDSLLKNIQNKELLKTKNGKPLFIVNEMIKNPHQINNLNIHNGSIYFNFDQYMWSITPEYSSNYKLRLFLENDYSFEEYESQIKCISYSDPFFIDFESKSFNSENLKFFKNLHLILTNRIMPIENIFKIINRNNI